MKKQGYPYVSIRRRLIEMGVKPTVELMTEIRTYGQSRPCKLDTAINFVLKRRGIKKAKGTTLGKLLYKDSEWDH